MAAAALLALGVALPPPAVGDSADAEWCLSPLPLAFYSSDTGLAGGLTVVATRDGDETERDVLLRLSGTYTQKHQGEITLGASVPLADGAYLAEGEYGFFSYPSVFYGAAPEHDLEEDYESRKAELETALLRRVGPRLFLGPAVDGGYQDFESLPSGGRLAAALGAEAESERFAGLGLVSRLDSRDNPRYTTRGVLLEARAIGYRVSTDAPESSRAFGRLVLDARSFATVGDLATLAVRGTATLSAGDPPLSRMSELGGLSLLRGYPADRFLGANGLTAQAEFRLPLFWRLRWVFFGAAGSVAEDPGGLLTRTPRVAGGAGLRLAVNKQRDVNIRIDAGLSPEGTGLYVTLMEAF